MKSPAPTGQFATLLSRLVSRQLAPGDAARIEAYLRGSKEARDYYRLYLAVHQDLAEHFQEHAAAPFPPLAAPARPLRMLALAALIPLSLGLGLWWAPHPKSSAAGPPPVAESDSETVLAVTGHCTGLHWNLAVPPAAGVNLARTPVTLEQGTLVLHLVGGQTLTLQSPARFELLNDREMHLELGDAALRIVKGGKGYLMRVPGGSVADLGTEFSVKVTADGSAHVWVFEGAAVVSKTEDGKRTRFKRSLTAGESARIDETLAASPLAPEAFLRPHLEASRLPSPAGQGYAKAVGKSAPLAWWRFEEISQNRIAAATTGTPPLVLAGSPKVIGPPGHRFFYTDTDENAGHAAPASGIAGLVAPAGTSIECLIHPESERHMTAVLLENFSLPVAEGQERHAQQSHIERVGRSGEAIGQVHPPYAIRGMIRTQSGYSGGVNAYTLESYLARRWIHVVQTHDGETLRLFVDGKLADEATALHPRHGDVLHPVIAILRPTPAHLSRQWSGGIDEVALYNRALSPAEIQAHFESLDR